MLTQGKSAAGKSFNAFPAVTPATPRKALNHVIKNTGKGLQKRSTSSHEKIRHSAYRSESRPRSQESPAFLARCSSLCQQMLSPSLLPWLLWPYLESGPACFGNTSPCRAPRKQASFPCLPLPYDPPHQACRSSRWHPRTLRPSCPT